MTPQTASLLAEYNRWMNQSLYAAASTLPEPELTRDRGAFFGSILQTLNHIAVADMIWLHRFATVAPQPWLEAALQAWPYPGSLRQQVAQTLPELRTCRESLDAIIIEWASKLTEDQLAQKFSYANMAGQKLSKHYGSVIMHFFNHQTHHRGQASTLLFQAGVDVGVTDLHALIPFEVS